MYFYIAYFNLSSCKKESKFRSIKSWKVCTVFSPPPFKKKSSDGIYKKNFSSKLYIHHIITYFKCCFQINSWIFLIWKTEILSSESNSQSPERKHVVYWLHNWDQQNSFYLLEFKVFCKLRGFFFFFFAPPCIKS